VRDGSSEAGEGSILVARPCGEASSHVHARRRRPPRGESERKAARNAKNVTPKLSPLRPAYFSTVLTLRPPLPKAKGLEGCSLAQTDALALRDAALRIAPQDEGEGCLGVAQKRPFFLGACGGLSHIADVQYVRGAARRHSAPLFYQDCRSVWSRQYA